VINARMLKTGDQLKAARILARLDQAEVAERAGLHINTISLMERRGPELLVSGLDVVAKVTRVLEDAGVMLVEGNGHGPGVILKTPTAETAPKTRARSRAKKLPPTKKRRPRRSQPFGHTRLRHNL
jgi:transcriptional regulator with XRE-family HTH domain